MTAYEILRATGAMGSIGLILFLSGKLKRSLRRMTGTRRACHV